MVRLKGGFQEVGLFNDYQFQFHNGSIKSLEISDAIAEVVVFQFHNGSIKRKCIARLWQRGLQFQFHNGSIKRWFIVHTISIT